MLATMARGLGSRRETAHTQLECSQPFTVAKRMKLNIPRIVPALYIRLFSPPAHAVFVVFQQDALGHQFIANCIRASKIS